MQILFHINQLGIRGTEVAVYDYAHFNEQLLGNKSSIIVPNKAEHHPQTLQKFKDRFPLYFYDDIAQIDPIITDINANAFYALKAGNNDGIASNIVPSLIHVVFKNNEPHGTIYAYISEWLSNEVTQGMSPYVPHMIWLPNYSGNMRQKLGIPDSAIVFGRYGGMDTFDIPFVKRVIYSLAKKSNNIYFLFMNTDNFIENKKGFFRKKYWKWLSHILFPQSKFNNIIFVPGTTDAIQKVEFINTCDAMIHARAQGESFGLACGEFSIKNKPVLTCNSSKIAERAHIEILSSKGLYYKDANELKQLIHNFQKYSSGNFDAYSQNYSPEAVMKKFKEVFLDPISNV
ncbi:MAG: hypothetical protein SFY32_16860 [Bacteroidota bacterium]|nr:hypothetical protein [Bacteroidota bacterium]